MIAANRNDLRRLFELDEEFHRAIHRAAGLLSVADELEDVKVHLNRLRFVSVNWPRGADKITGEHEAILAALRARDKNARGRGDDSPPARRASGARPHVGGKRRPAAAASSEEDLRVKIVDIRATTVAMPLEAPLRHAGRRALGALHPHDRRGRHR